MFFAARDDVTYVSIHTPGGTRTKESRLAQAAYSRMRVPPHPNLDFLDLERFILKDRSRRLNA